MAELNTIRRLLRQQEITYEKQKKYDDGHYRFITEESDTFPLGQAYIIDIKAYHVASDFYTPVYVKKGSEEKREEEQHYALVNLIQHILLENESKDLLESSHQEYMGVIPLKEYAELIATKATKIEESLGDAQHHGVW